MATRTTTSTSTKTTSRTTFTIPDELVREAQLALDNAMCGDFCLDAKCAQCARARLEAVSRVASRVTILKLQHILRLAQAQVEDELLHRDATRVLKRAIEELQ